MSSSVKTNKRFPGQICFSFYGPIISRNYGLNKGQQAFITWCGVPWIKNWTLECEAFFKIIWPQDPFIMKHFTAPVLWNWGLEKTCPGRCGWFKAKPGWVSASFELRRFGIFWELPIQGTSREGPPVLTSLGSSSPCFRGQRPLPPSKEGRAPFINLLAALGTLCMEWGLWSVSN